MGDFFHPTCDNVFLGSIQNPRSQEKDNDRKEDCEEGFQEDRRKEDRQEDREGRGGYRAGTMTEKIYKVFVSNGEGSSSGSQDQSQRCDRQQLFLPITPMG